MDKNSIARKPSIVEIGNSMINFSLLHRSLKATHTKTIREQNRLLFELLNPENRYTKLMILENVMKYKDSFLEFEKFFGYGYLISKFTETLKDEINKYGSLNKLKYDNFRNRLKTDEKEVIYNKLRLALMKDLSCNNLVFVPCDKTHNIMDFYIDGIKNYGEPTLHEIILQPEGEKVFLNSNEFVITVFVDIEQFIFHLSECDDSFKSEQTSVKEIDERKSFVSKCVLMSLLSAVIRDNFRMIATQQLMYYLSLFKTDSLLFLNTSSVKYFYESTHHITDDKKEIVDTFVKTYNDHINAMKLRKRNSNEGLHFIDLYTILKRIDLDPTELLTIIEPSTYVVNTILKSIFGENIYLPKSYAHTSNLYRHDDVCDECKMIHNTIAANRLLPLMYINTFLLQFGERMQSFTKIEQAIVDFLNNTKTQNSNYINGTMSLFKVFENNEDFYTDLRSAFHNPLKITELIKEAMMELLSIGNECNDSSDEKSIPILATKRGQ